MRLVFTQAPGEVDVERMEFDMFPPGFRVIQLAEEEMETRVVRLDHMPFEPQRK